MSLEDRREQTRFQAVYLRGQSRFPHGCARRSAVPQSGRIRSMELSGGAPPIKGPAPPVSCTSPPMCSPRYVFGLGRKTKCMQTAQPYVICG